MVPIDFILLEMDEDSRISIILGNPFLATIGDVIDVKNHKFSSVVEVIKLSLIYLNPLTHCSLRIDVARWIVG